jgi:hypothetical protein
MLKTSQSLVIYEVIINIINIAIFYAKKLGEKISILYFWSIKKVGEVTSLSLQKLKKMLPTAFIIKFYKLGMS